MKKVCHLTTVHPIDDTRIFNKECISLAANNFDVTLIVCGNFAFEDEKKGVKRIALKIPVKSRLERFWKRPKIIFNKALEIDAEIYHLHDPELLPIGLKLKNRNKKVIFDSHEFYGEQLRSKNYIPFLIRNILVNLYMNYETHVCKRIDAVIQVCTLEGIDYFEKRAKKTIFINNTPKIKEQNKINFIPFGERRFITYIGSLSYNRGITHLIKASALSRVILILGGSFISEKYYKKIKNLKEYSYVKYKGYINNNQKDNILNMCFAGVSTLLQIRQYAKIDTLPTKVYEYMEAGIPCIISNTPYAKKMIEKYNMGICVNPSNIEEIVNAIEFLKNNIEISRKMGQNGQEAFKKYFNWIKEEKKLIKLYVNL